MDELSGKQIVTRFTDLKVRVSRLEDVKKALEISVGVCTAKLEGLARVNMPEIYDGLVDLKTRLVSLEGVAVPKLGRDLTDLEKRLSKLEMKEIPNLCRGCVENHDRINILEEVVESEERGGVRYLQEAQDNLDRITLPKWSNDLVDLEKRLSKLERRVAKLANWKREACIE